MGEMRSEGQLGPQRLAVNFVVTPQVIFFILEEGCLQDLGLLWDRHLNEVLVAGYTTS